MGFTNKFGIITEVMVLLFSSQFISVSDENFISIIPLDQLTSDNTYICEIKENVLSLDYYSRLIALNSIEKTIKSGSFSPIKNELVCILYHVCTQDNLTAGETTSIHIIKKSVELLGRMGEKTRYSMFAYQLEDVLISLLYKDDINIISSIIYSLGVIGHNEKGKTIKALDLIVDKWVPRARNDEFALAVITCIEKIAEINNGIEEWEANIILIKIMQSNYDKLIREKALAVMGKLRSY